MQAEALWYQRAKIFAQLKGRLGRGTASRQAGTRVHAEQAPKRAMREPTLRQ